MNASLVKRDGTQWHQIENLFNNEKFIQLARMFGLAGNSANAPNPFLDAHEILLAWGDLELPTVEDVSAVLFNGTTFSPFIFTKTCSIQPGTLNTMFVEQQAHSSVRPPLTCHVIRT